MADLLRDPNRRVIIALENEALKRENDVLARKIDTLTRESTDWKNIYDELKKSLGEVQVLSPRQAMYKSDGELDVYTFSEEGPGTIDELRGALRQKDKQLNETVRQLNRTKKQLSDAQEELSVSREVAKATQIRELKQEGIYENLITDQIYENLRLGQEEDASANPQPTETGFFVVFSSNVE